MKYLLTYLILITAAFGISAERTIVIYNTASPESKSIADHYKKARNIPENNIIGLDLPLEDEITIKQYLKDFKTPLGIELDQRKLWKREGSQKVTSTKFDVIVTIYGVPFKTKSTLIPATKDADGNPIPEKRRKVIEVDGASIDSELTLLHGGDYPLIRPLNNPFFKKEIQSPNVNPIGIFLVGRIDGPSPEICIRMINDAIQTEKRGLQGMCYLDKAFKGGGFDIGDQWLESIYENNKQKGIVTIIEETSDVFVTNYPMEDVALYYGWYSHHVSGAFLNPKLRLKKGSIITHLHSFSASKLRNPKARWSGPILAKGAAFTLGNVHEPGLELTTHLDYFHKELLSGKTVIESAWSATPAISWQNVALGDPLYRPFASVNTNANDHYSKLSKLAPINTKSKFNDLLKLTEKEKSPELHEAVGLIYTRLKAHEKCLTHFRKAQKLAPDDETQVRNIHHQIAYHRKQNQREKALTVLKANFLTYKEKPIGKSLAAIGNILSPPAPDPVKPAK